MFIGGIMAPASYGGCGKSSKLLGSEIFPSEILLSELLSEKKIYLQDIICEPHRLESIRPLLQWRVLNYPYSACHWGFKECFYFTVQKWPIFQLYYDVGNTDKPHIINLFLDYKYKMLYVHNSSFMASTMHAWLLWHIRTWLLMLLLHDSHDTSFMTSMTHRWLLWHIHDFNDRYMTPVTHTWLLWHLHNS